MKEQDGFVSPPSALMKVPKMGLSRRNAFALCAGLPILQVLSSTQTAHAAFPDQDEKFEQVPGVIRWRVGTVEVTAISDGVSTLPLDVVPKADPVVAKELADAAFLPPGDAIPIAINTYLVRSGNKVALVDTGGGRFFGPQAGCFSRTSRLPGSLQSWSTSLSSPTSTLTM